MSDAGFVIAGYLITAVVLLAYVAWMAARFRRVRRGMTDEELEQWR